MLKRLLAIFVAFAAGAAVMILGFGGADSPSSDALDVHFTAGYPGRLFVGDTVVYDGTPTTTTTTEAPTSTASASTTTTVEPSTSTTTVPSTSSTTTVSPSTSTAVPPTPTPTTSTTVAPSTTSTSTTTTGPATTTTVSGGGGSAGCGLAAAAFCETFDAPYNGGTQTGDLDPVVWGVSRLGDWNPGQILNGFVMSHNACDGGGTTGSTPPGDGSSHTVGPNSPIPSDVRVCGGQMVESINDGGATPNTDTYPKQPFSFTGRTGKVVFDISADSSGTHGAWPEFLITDEPVPGVHRCISECPLGRGGVPTAQNEIGFSLAGGAGATGGTTGVDQFFGSRGGTYFDLANNCSSTWITKGSRAAMNHIEVSVSTTQIDVWGTDAGSSTLKHIGCAAISPGLGFSQGLVWLNDARYNAHKAVEPCECGTQYDHSFAWDNLGFDGPKTYRDLGFDVPLANAANGNAAQSGDTEYVNEGYQLDTPKTFTLTNVVKGTATAAKVVVNVYTRGSGASMTVSVNGHTPVSHATPVGFHPDSFSIVVPLTDVVAGTNTLRFTATDGSTSIANPTLIMVAAAAVP